MKIHAKAGIAFVFVLFAFMLRAQNAAPSLPSAPQSNLPRLATTAASSASSNAQAANAPHDTLILTRSQAEQIALNNNPRIRIGQLLARLQHEVVRERRADELPTLTGNATVVGANQASRISSGYLTASTLLQHAGMGVQANQLISDFGRTHNLIAAAQFAEKARDADAEATRQEIVLAADQAFYTVIEAQETVKVASQTVVERQTLADQVSALAASKLRSDLDLSFAQVNYSQAKLLQLNAQNNLDAAMTALNDVLGYDTPMHFNVVEDSDSLPSLPPSSDALIELALQQRPDLQSLRYGERAAQKFSTAQRLQMLPTISASGIVGTTPLGASQYFGARWYGAAGGNIDIPVFNGFRLSAQAKEAQFQSQAASEQTRALLDEVVRDVRTAWLNANTALQRVTVSAELLRQANSALELARTRYDLGLSSIVELSQAELQQTEAAINNASANARYRMAIATINYQIGAPE